MFGSGTGKSGYMIGGEAWGQGEEGGGEGWGAILIKGLGGWGQKWGAYMPGLPGVFMKARAILAGGVLDKGQQHTEHGQAAEDALIPHHLQRGGSNVTHNCTHQDTHPESP